MTLTLLLEMSAAGHGERVAFGPPGTGITFTGLARRAAEAAALIKLRDPRHLVFIGRTGPALPVLLFAAASAGVPFVPLNYRLTPQRLRELVSELELPFVVADQDYRAQVGEEYDAVDTDTFLAEAAVQKPATPADVSDTAVALLLFTSGTTSRPKAAVLRHRNLVAYIMSTVEFQAAGLHETALVTVPPYHIAGIAATLSNLYAGRRVIYLPDFEPHAWLRLIRDEGITTAMVVPTMLARVLDTLGGRTADAPTLQLISYGGARMPRTILERALTAFPNTGFCNAYGLTESSSTIALLGPEDHREAYTSDDPAVRQRLGSVGRPVPGVDIEIRDENRVPVSPGATGQLWVRGIQVSGEYRDRGSVLDKDGWFDTHDRAHMDSFGYLYVAGRSDDVIVHGGENIAPAEIEEVLAEHPAVKDVVVLGIPDDEWGEQLVAVVVPHADGAVDADQLLNYVRSRLRGSRTPQRVVWRTTLPYTTTGKLLRRQLVEEIVNT